MRKSYVKTGKCQVLFSSREHKSPFSLNTFTSSVFSDSSETVSKLIKSSYLFVLLRLSCSALTPSILQSSAIHLLSLLDQDMSSNILCIFRLCVVCFNSKHSSRHASADWRENFGLVEQTRPSPGSGLVGERSGPLR